MLLRCPQLPRYHELDGQGALSRPAASTSETPERLPCCFNLKLPCCSTTVPGAAAVGPVGAVCIAVGVHSYCDNKCVER